MKWTYRHTNMHIHMLEKQTAQVERKNKTLICNLIFSYHELFFMGFKTTKGLNFQ